jgi:hypothetical protein
VFLLSTNQGISVVFFQPRASGTSSKHAISTSQSDIISTNISSVSLKTSQPLQLALDSTASKGEVKDILDDGSGPIPFCQMSFTLYRTEIRDMICNNINDNDTLFGIIPKSQQAQIQFLHIPKTGGESLEIALGIDKNHSTWWERRNWYLEGGPSTGLAVTIIRNPYDRMYSWFKFCLHGWRKHLPKPHMQCLKAHELIHSHASNNNSSSKEEEKGDVTYSYQQQHQHLNNMNNQNSKNATKASVALAFETWVQHVFLDQQLTSEDIFQIILPAYDYLGGVTPLHLDYIIRFEHYADDYAILARALGKKVPLRHKNGSSNADRGRLDGNNPYNVTYDEEIGNILNTPYRDMYTETARKMVEMHFAADLITFNYTF